MSLPALFRDDLEATLPLPLMKECDRGATSQVGGPLDGQAPPLVRGGQVVPFFATHSSVGAAPTATNPPGR